MLSAKILNMCYHHLMDFEKERMEVAATMARLYERTLTTATGGNVSARVGDVMLITPSGKDKASLKAEDIAVVDIATGCQIGTSWRLSIESEMHRSIYLKTDAKAVVHSHPTFASLYSALDETIDTHIIAETYYLLDEVVIGVKGQVLVETSIVISMTAFNLAIMSWCSRTNQLVLNAKFLTQQV